jgi:hypothetical protein
MKIDTIMKIDTHQFIARSSDKRDTFQIKDTEFGLDFIKSLRPVDYILDVRNDYITEAPEYPTEPASEDQIKDYEKKYNEWVESRSLTPIVPNGENKRSRFHHGLIAQEVKSVLESKGIDFGGFQDRKIKGGEDVLGIVYEELIAPLIKAVQELSAKVEALESK